MWYKSTWDIILPDERKAGRLIGNFSIVAASVGGLAGVGLKVGANEGNVKACETQLDAGQSCTVNQVKDYTSDMLSAPLMVAAVIAGGAGVMLRKLTS